MNPGDLVTLNIEKVAHGGFCVARYEGVVIFVKHALPGETVEAKLISLAPGKRSWFAQVEKVIQPSVNRKKSDCDFFKADGCGGCDWQHTTSQYQRDLKLEVLVEQISRFAQVENASTICSMNAVAPSEKNWRTRIRLVANESGNWGFRKFRSHEIQAIDNCLIAEDSINGILKTLPTGQFEEEIQIIKSKDETIVFPVSKNFQSIPNTKQEVAGIDFEASGNGFWQVHPGATLTLSSQIKKEIKNLTINSFADLYAGVGVFAYSVLEDFPQTQSFVVETNNNAANNARKNLEKYKSVQVFSTKVENWLQGFKSTLDLVILDPPRAGAGKNVMELVCAKSKKMIIYIACDPASLARDVLTARNLGWTLLKVEAFDLFPMTHHFESVAVLVRD